MKKILGAALEIAVRFFFSNFTYSFGGKTYIQCYGGPIGARLTMCVARIVLQQWREDFQRILNRAEIEEKLSRIYVDDNRTVLSYLKEGMRFNERVGVFEFKERWKKEDSERDKVSRTLEEIGKAMNYVNDDLKFTIEREADFENGRLPTLAFEIWSTKEGIRHSYYEKGMRSQILTQKRSSQAENSKFSILTNELARRFEMLDSKIDTEEKTSIVDHFTQQLWNSGYSWQQIREVVVSSIKGFERKELHKREKKIERYRTSEMSLQSSKRSCWQLMNILLLELLCQ